MPAATTVKRQTGAKYMVMDADVPVVESGGKTDFQYGSDKTLALRRRPRSIACCTIGDTVELGGARVHRTTHTRSHARLHNLDDAGGRRWRA